MVILEHHAIVLALQQALMEAICGLSYTGDIRMRWGEDRQKVQRIAEGSWSPLAQMFLGPMQVQKPFARYFPCADLSDASQLKPQLTLEES